MSRTTDLRNTHRTVDEILASMTDDEIANLTDAQIEALAEQVADRVCG